MSDSDSDQESLQAAMDRRMQENKVEKDKSIAERKSTEPIESPSRPPINPSLGIPLENLSLSHNIKVTGNDPTIILCSHNAQEAGLNPNSLTYKEKPKRADVEADLDNLRFYYKTILININPVPWFNHGNLELDDYFTELIIKEISSGRDVSAKNELDFRQIVKNVNGGMVRTLVEGSPGYGKSTLARRITVDWGRKADYMDHFKLVLFVTCRDLDGRSLEKFMADTYSQFESLTLKDWKTSEDVLFILDGLDECKPEDAKTINGLLEHRFYMKASVLATSRPLGEDTLIHVHNFKRKVVIKGFNRERIEKLIDLFFKDKAGRAEEMKTKFFSGNQAYRNLATCPLLCQLFCLLFEDDEDLPEKVTEVYYELIKCIIKRERSSQGGGVLPHGHLPEQYEHMLRSFGKMCIHALKEDKFYFTKDEIFEVLPNEIHNYSHQSDVILGFLVKSGTRMKSIRHNHDWYQPIHKTFLEFVAAVYLKSLVESQNDAQLDEDLKELQLVEQSAVEQVLQYTVEILGERSHPIISRLGNIIYLKDAANLRLLSTAGCSDKNIQALTSVMNLEKVEMKASLKEIDAWTNICCKSDVIKELRFHWDPSGDSMTSPKILNFFHEIEKRNTSIEKISMSIFHGIFKSKSDPGFEEQEAEFHEEAKKFGEAVLCVMCKRNLQQLEVGLKVIGKDRGGEIDFVDPVISSIVDVFQNRLECLEISSLVLDLDISTSNLSKLVKVLIPYQNLVRLSMSRLVLDYDGYKSLAQLILDGSLRELELKLNIGHFWFSATSGSSDSPQLSDAYENAIKAAFVHTERQRKVSRDEFHTDVRRDSVKLEVISESDVDSLQEMTENDKWDVEDIKQLISEDNVLREIKTFLNVSDSEESLATSSFSQGEGQVFHVEVGEDICPLPACLGHGDTVSGFHYLFRAMRDPICKLRKLHLNQCLQAKQPEYFACLSAAMAENKSIEELKISGTVKDVTIPCTFPLFLSLRPNSTLKVLDLGGIPTVIKCDLFMLLLKVLSKNSTLRKLSLSNWNFDLDISNASLSEKSKPKSRITIHHIFKQLKETLASTKLRQLVMDQAELRLNGLDLYTEPPKSKGHREEEEDSKRLQEFHDSLQGLRFHNKSLESLNLAGTLIVMDFSTIHVKEVVQVLDLPNLKELDLSEPSRSQAGDASRFVSTYSMSHFFQVVSQQFTRLETLRIANWTQNASLDKITGSKVKSRLRQLTSLKNLYLDGYCYHDDDSSEEVMKGTTCLLKVMLKALPNLAHVSLVRGSIGFNYVLMLVRTIKAIMRSKDKFSINSLHMNGKDLELMLSELNKKKINFSYESKTGVITFQPPRSKPLPEKVQNFCSKLL